MNFYLIKNAQRIGPYSVEQVQAFLKQGLITSIDLVWAEGWPSWIAIADVPGLSTPSTVAPSYPPGSRSTPFRDDGASGPGTSGGLYVHGKNPILACVLSLLIVGTGQFYNGDWGKGAFLLVTCIFASFFSFGTLWIFWALISALDAYMVAQGRDRFEVRFSNSNFCRKHLIRI